MIRLILGAKWSGLHHAAPALGPARSDAGALRVGPAQQARVEQRGQGQGARSRWSNRAGTRGDEYEPERNRDRYGSWLQLRVMVSCRFKSTRATDVQAASSAGSMSAGDGESPVAEQGAGRGGLVLRIDRGAWPSRPRRTATSSGRAGARAPGGTLAFEPGARVGASLADDAGGEDPGGLDVGRVVQEDEGLERRVRPRPLDDAFLAGRGIEGQQAGMQEGALPVRVQAAAVLVFALVGDVVALGEIEEDPVARRLIGLDAGPADLARRAGRSRPGRCRGPARRRAGTGSAAPASGWPGSR